MRLGDLASVASGASWARGDERSTPDPQTLGALRVANMKSDRLDISDLRFIVPSAEARRKVAVHPAVMLVRTNTAERVGNAQFVPLEAAGLAYSSFLILVTPHEFGDARLIGRFLQAPQCQSEISGKASGSTAGLKNVPVTWLRELPIPTLSADERVLLLAPIDAVESTISGLEAKCRGLYQFRVSVMSLLLSGVHEIPVSYDRFLRENGIALEPASVMV